MESFHEKNYLPIYSVIWFDEIFSKMKRWNIIDINLCSQASLTFLNAYTDMMDIAFF